MKNIMFVCSGNICRSPMAHAYMQKKINDLNMQNEYNISSCGTNAYTGDSATYNAIVAMKKYDVDLTKHRATNIKDSDIVNCDYIFGLTNEHKGIILQLYPLLKGKVYTLKEFINNNEKYKDIDDPWGLDINVYKATAEEIVKNVDKLLKIL